MSSSPAESPTGPPPGPARIAGVAAGVLTGAGFLLLLLLMLSLGLRRGVNHDEIQHLAAGAVFGRHFLLPYRDFPYFHMPYLVFIYGFLFKWCACLLAPARILCAVAGWMTLVLIWLIVWRECVGRHSIVRWILPAGAVLLLFSNPIFREGYWRTWNHAIATLFGLGAVALAMRPGQRWRWFWAGIFIGLAIGTRLTFAPLAAPLAAAPAWAPEGGDIRQRIGNIARFCGGSALALLPAFILFAMAPAQFYFGNFAFNSKFNTLFRQSQSDQRATFHAKLIYPFTTLFAERANLILAILFLLLLVAALVWVFKMQADARYRFLLILTLLPFAFVGAFAASPSQEVYYYAFAVLMVLTISVPAAAFCEGKGAWIVAPVILAIAILTTTSSWHEYQRLAILKKPAEWPAVGYREAGIEAARVAGHGPILTLSPLIPLEGGLDIYPHLVTEGIGWRTEPFIAAPDRVRFMILGPDNFAELMARTPPGAVLTAPSSQLDGPLIAWARSHGYVPHLLDDRGKLVDRATVWTRPP